MQKIDMGIALCHFELAAKEAGLAPRFVQSDPGLAAEGLNILHPISFNVSGGTQMSKILVAYFSASGVTRTTAEKLAAVAKADLFEIRPETPYTAEDLDYTKKTSRSTLEMQDENCRPALAADALDVAKYDVVFVGFPIWWGREPSIIDSFVEAHDLSGKRVIPFCTSGGGGFANRAQLEKLVPGLEAHKALWNGITDTELEEWLAELSL